MYRLDTPLLIFLNTPLHTYKRIGLLKCIAQTHGDTHLHNKLFNFYINVLRYRNENIKDVLTANGNLELLYALTTCSLFFSQKPVVMALAVFSSHQ